ncbi:MAG: alpha/beta hydrolase [Herpetosiphonaceae bacterium]|nr:alpha/beta hydrolase [Herpetosiphonaceae bacterium]
MHDELEIEHYPAHQTPCHPPLLFLHGGWHGAWCWTPHFAPFFQRTHDVVLMSLRGHGHRTERNHHPTHTLKEYAQDLQTVIGTLNQPPIIIAHSMGGLIAQKYLDMFGDTSISGLFLMGSLPVRGSWKLILQPFFLKRIFRSIQLLVLSNAEQAFKDRSFLKGMFFSKQFPDDMLPTYADNLRNESRLIIVQLVLSGIKLYSDKNIPVGVMGGLYDMIISKKITDAIATYMHTQAVYVPTAHDFMLDTHWQTAANHLLTWIKDNFDE